jgi:hypothetical protein
MWYDIPMDARLDEIFRWSDRMFSAGLFEEVESELHSLDLTELPTSAICAYQIVANLPEVAGDGDKFPYRREFQARARAEFERRNEPDVEGLMRGFEY